MQDWAYLEERVRKIAERKWRRPAVSTEVAGVRLDCVIDLGPKWIICEVSREATIDKLRTDLAKFGTVRPALFARNIFPECYFITSSRPSDGLRTSAREQHVQCYHVDEFERLFLDYRSYVFERNKNSFGSMMNIYTKAVEDMEFIPVKYQNQADQTEVSINWIAEKLASGAKIILLGEFGSGKSRCVRECFKELSKTSNLYTFAIDLRDHWGAKRGSEILNRHFEDLGLSTLADPVRSISKESITCFLLDGFDELGIQSWSEDPGRIRELRANSLKGAADLIFRTAGGVLITGRHHYFNSNDEMFSSLGLEKENVIVLSCFDEFSDSEFEKFLSQLHLDFQFPQWLPRRPVICQLFAGLSQQQISEIANSDAEETQVWHKIIDFICSRDASINAQFSSSEIFSILRFLSRVTRASAEDVGPITQADLSDAFVYVRGQTPVGEAAALLSRLPALGRVSSDSGDRRFVDRFILDGLRAIDISTSAYEASVEAITSKKWRHPLRGIGITLLGTELRENANIFLSLMRKSVECGNSLLALDIVCAASFCDDLQWECGGILINDATAAELRLGLGGVCYLILDNCVIETLDIEDSQLPGVNLKNCLIQRIRGVTSVDGLPDSFEECSVDLFDSTENRAAIRQLELTEPQRALMSVLHKTFNQKGRGRKEGALLRGGVSADEKRVLDRILRKLVSDGLLYTSPGDEGIVYHPKRDHTRRVRSMLSQMKLSDDPLWNEITSWT